MKILIYGAGVIGCEMAHALMNAGNDVTLLARGEWKDQIEKKGLVIRHPLQMHTTVDRPRVVSELKPEDHYDLVFAVMQFTQVQSILPVLAASQSRYVVLVGNNMAAEACARKLTEGNPLREVAFGFQGTAGRRENGRLISLHVGKVGMTVGALNGNLSSAFQTLLAQAANGRYRLTWENHMDAWLKCHMAFILPICYVCYRVGGQLPRATGAQLNAIIDAAAEAYGSLRALGYPIRPDGAEEALINGRRKIYWMLRIMAKTPLGRLAASDHAMRAQEEMAALDAAFEALRSQSNIPMPVWDALRSETANAG